MIRKLWKEAGRFFFRLISSRLFILAVLFSILFSILIVRLFRLQIIEGAQYQEEYILKIEKEIQYQAPRGNIYDCNGKTLACNELAYTVTIEDKGDYSTADARNWMLYRLAVILEQHGEEVKGQFKVRINQNGDMEYSFTTKAAKKQFFMNFYGLSSSELLNDSEGRYSTKITAREAFERKQTDYGFDELKDEMGNPVLLSDATALDMVNMLYTMKLTEFQKYKPVPVADRISEETMVAILENSSQLQGVSVEPRYLRVYPYGPCASPIIGYTGTGEEGEMTGRSGIEKVMDEALQGTYGYKKLYVDNMGRERGVLEEQSVVVGNDVYLSIDAELQKAVYHLIEKQLAQIIAEKLIDGEPDPDMQADATKRQIPVKDAYFQFIHNHVLLIEDMGVETAEPVEKEIYAVYQKEKKEKLNEIQKHLESAQPIPVSQLPSELQDYMRYIVAFLKEEGIISTDKIKQDSDSFKAWSSGNISLEEYLYAGIGEGWIDVTNLESGSRYMEQGEAIRQLATVIVRELENDEGFAQEIFYHLIERDAVTGQQLCRALYAQGALAYDQEAIDQLERGDSSYAYSFLRDKILNTEITPAQLALDPCTAGVVVTDVNTGKVRALVSYPSYDNNMMTDTVSEKAFSRLLNDLSMPLYNNATQAAKAPGSVFKPITAIAALEEGIVSETDVIVCGGQYSETAQPIKCTGVHGAETMILGIQNSCNVFFSELAHRLSLSPDGTYSADQGAATLQKYAAMFGLNETTGIELSETAPNMSDADPERSALGQGTHAYANVQLARYTAALANRGTVYRLSLLDKQVNANGVILKQYEPEVSEKLTISENTWNVVQAGMRRVITDGTARKVFSDTPIAIAGKTGTAQESLKRGNHAFFISFAPYDHPEIAVTVNIPFGYAGVNAAELGEKVYEYYYGYLTMD